MAFIVEDGTGVKGANSYCTVQYMRDYFADRGVDLTAVADAALQASLIAATDYIDTRWGSRFLGSRTWASLHSRAVFSLTAQPADGETVTLGPDVLTFRVAAVLDTEVEIGHTLAETLGNLVAVAAAVNTDGLMLAALMPDPDVAAVAIYFIRDGVAVATTAANGAFDGAASDGVSGKRQPLEFPRTLAVGVPEKVKMATCAYANRARSAPLAPDGVIDNTIVSQSTSVGPISKSTTFNTGAALNPIKAYPAADRLLREFVRSGDSVMRS